MLHKNLKGYRAHLFSVVAVAALVLSACSTMEPMELQGPPVQRYHGDGFTIRVEFLDEAYLRARYGQRNNTFIAPPGVSSERIMVFEIDIDSERDLRLDVSSIELHFGPTVRQAHNRFNFGQYWSNIDELEGRPGIESRRRQSEIDASLLPNRTQLSPGGSESGLAVFRGRFPRYGTATVFIPIADSTGRPFDRAELDFEF